MGERLNIGITIGDYNGVGPEVIIKTLADERMFHNANYIIYGHKSIISSYTKLLRIQNFNIQEITNFEKLHHKIPNVINCWEEQVNVQPSEATTEAGSRALICLNRALKDLTDKKIDVLVTGPVNKNTIAQNLPDFKGQTEYIALQTGSETSLMLLVNDDLRVGLVSNHLPIKEVATKIDIPQVISKIELLNKTLRQDFLLEKPRIAVLGLNPHAGDNSLLGKEEKEVIAPAVSRARERGIIAIGPFAADGFFGARQYAKFDAVLAMYHDQGLVPFKTISFGEGVNYTAGLSVIRTSPDHGTGYDIAGKNLASPDSFRQAIFLAIDVHNNRADYSEMTADPVEKMKISRDKDGGDA